MRTKKLISVLLAPVLCMTFMPLAALAANWQDVLTYTVDKYYEEVAITGCIKTASGDLVIPEEIKGYPVTEIYDGVFQDCTGLTSVTIPSGVYYLDSESFEGCTSLTAVNVSAKNEDYSSIDGVVFDKAGEELIFCPPGRSGVYVVPDTVEMIDMFAFDGCSLLVSITVPAGVGEMDESSFDGCRGLTAIDVSAGNKYYSSIDGVLFDKKAEILLCYPEGKTGESYTVPDGVKDIGAYAFEGNTFITRVVLPDSLITLGYYAFSDCTAFTAFETGAGNTKFSAVDGVLFDKDISVLINFPVGLKGEYTVPESVKYIADSAFSYCGGLTGITLPAGLEVIDAFAFAGCAGLISVLIPGSVTRIGYTAFGDCDALATVGIGEGVRAIDDDAFAGCGALMHINLPDSLERVGYGIIEDTPIFDNEANWVNHTLYLDACLLATDSGVSGAFAVKEGTRVIAAGALCFCDRLTAVTFPAGLVAIGDGAFEYCEELTKIVIPDSVRIIGYGAFAECFGIESITLPDTLEEIGYGAFMDTVCYGDPEDWAGGMLYIEDYFIELNTEYKGNIVIRDGTRGIATAAGSFCEGLTGVSIPNGVGFIGEQAFAACPLLLSVTVPGSVTRIGEYSFGYLPNYETRQFIPMPGFTMRGLANSEAQNYADSNKITFIALSPLDPLDALAVRVAAASGTVTCVKNQLTAAAFLALFTDSTGMSVSSGGNPLAASVLVGTGCELLLPDNTKLTVVILGDTDGNGKVTVADARQTLRVSAKIETFPTAAKSLAADTDGDGKTTMPDARTVLRAAANIAPLTLPALPG